MDIFPSRRSICWHSIRKAFPWAGLAAASSIVNALDRLGGNHSHAPAVSSSHARDGTVNKSAAGHMLPPNHPQTIWVRRIAGHLIATACVCDDKSRFGFGGRGSLLERIRWCPVNGGVDWRVDVVVDEEVIDAYSHYKGIVRMSTGFLKYMRTDADVAAVLGHEVAHVIARHGLQKRRNRWLPRQLRCRAAQRAAGQVHGGQVGIHLHTPVVLQVGAVLLVYMLVYYFPHIY